MSDLRCCAALSSEPDTETIAARNMVCEPQPATFARYCLNIAGWMVPSVVLALLPKCPLCLAAYLAIWTGLGITITTAAFLRTTLIILCVVSLIYLAISFAQRLVLLHGQEVKAVSK